MRPLIALLPVLIAFQAGAPPALAWTWPVEGPVLRPFALGDDPYAAGQHRGIDIAAAPGTDVRSPAPGRITFAGTVPGGGRTVTVETPDGYSVTLLHLGTIAVARDVPVDEGAVVGTVGPSGTPEHAQAYVHLGVRRTVDPNGYVDPLRLLPAPAPPPPAPERSEPQPEERQAPPPPGPEPAAPTESQPVADAETDEPPVASVAAEERRAAEAPGRPALAPRRAVSPRPASIATSSVVSPADEASARPDSARRADSGPPATGKPVRILEPQALETLSAHVSPPEQAKEPASPGTLGALARYLALAATLLGAGAVALAIRGRQLDDAGPAHAPPPVLFDAARGAAEDARRPGPAEEDRLVPHGDLEWIALGEPEPLADLDRDHDPAELVQVADDPRRRLAHTLITRRRSHRICSHRSSRPRRRGPLAAR